MERITKPVIAYKGMKRVTKENVEAFIADSALDNNCQMAPDGTLDFSSYAFNILMRNLSDEFENNPKDVNLLFDELKLDINELPKRDLLKDPPVTTTKT